MDLVTESAMKIEYNNLYTHFVFSTFGRQLLIPETSRDRIEKYITGIITHNSSELYAIYANPDHVHILISRSPALSEQQIATIVVDSSERFINENKLASGRFAWQKTASAFSISKADVDKVCRYILNQPNRYKKVTFTEEYE